MASGLRMQSSWVVLVAALGSAFTGCGEDDDTDKEPTPFPGAASCAVLGGANAEPDYPGLNPEAFAKAKPVSGCENAAEGLDGHVVLDISGTPARVSFPEGGLAVNGVRCTASNGAPIQFGKSGAIQITGGAGNDTLQIDLGEGTPGMLALAADTGLMIDLGAGENAVSIRGSSDGDSVATGESERGMLVDLDGDGEAEGVVSGATSLVASLGLGDDVYDGAHQGWGQTGIDLTACGGAGSDQLRGGAGLDRIEGGEGDDRLFSSPELDASDYFDGGNGTDTLDYSERAERVTVTFDDEMNDGGLDEGDIALGNFERLVGGQADDELHGTDGDETIDGGPGNDYIDGGAGRDILLGGEGDDTFFGGDVMDGSDVINGGAGHDEMSYADRSKPVVVTLCSAIETTGCTAPSCDCAADDGEDIEADQLVNVEGAHGGSGADRLIGDDGDNAFYGNGGDDLIQGGIGNDWMFGDDGTDTLLGEEGDDYLDGAADPDLFDAGAGQGDICVTDNDMSVLGCELF